MVFNNPTLLKVYDWMEKSADEDGFVNVYAGTVAACLNTPKRTIQGALARLERQGKVYFIRNGQFVVVAKATLDDIE